LSSKEPTKLRGGGFHGEYGDTPGEKLTDPGEFALGVIASMKRFMTPEYEEPPPEAVGAAVDGVEGVPPDDEGTQAH